MFVIRFWAMLRRMRRTVTLGLLLLSSAASAGTLDSPILGGTPTVVGDYPNVVGLEVGGGLCTGTLIDKEWVLTAAHCIKGISVGSIRVHFGTVNMFSSPGVTRTAVMAVPKPGFSENALGKNDIGLIKLNMPITDIKPVPVNLDPAKAPVGISVMMVGYGATQQGGGGSVGVQFEVPQTSISCQSWVGTNADLLCFSQTNGKGKCQGDSGGPSFAMIDGIMTQVGVTSFGDQNCADFGADTRTDAEKAFLLQYVPQLECSVDTDCPGDDRCFAKKCIKTPFTEGGLGSECTSAADCDSMVCGNDGSHAYCSQPCSLTVTENACPEGLACVETGDGATGTCWPIGDDSGCCDASGAGAPTAFFGFAFLGLMLGRRRKRR